MNLILQGGRRILYNLNKDEQVKLILYWKRKLTLDIDHNIEIDLIGIKSSKEEVEYLIRHIELDIQYNMY